MTTTGGQIARRGSAAAGGLTLERYVETMMPRWGGNSVKRWTRRGHYALEREDLLSEAALVLTEVWNKYAGVKPEGQLRRMGTGAIFQHVGNVFYHSNPWATKRSRLRGHVAPRMVSADQPVLSGNGSSKGLGLNPIDLHRAHRHRRSEPQLESLIARESAEAIPVADFRGPGADAVRKIFCDVARALRDDDGYLLMRAAEQLNYNQRGEIKMLGGATAAPESPEVVMHGMSGEISLEEKVARAPELGRPAKVKANLEKKVGIKARPSRADADARVATFKKGQRVRYKGGGRAPGLEAGAVMTVLGSVRSKGRMYLRLSRDADGVTRLVGMSAALVSKL